MKKYVTLLAVALLSHTSLGNAVKFDPTTASPAEFGEKNRKLTLKLLTPGISEEEKSDIGDQIKAVATMARFKFASPSDQVDLFGSLDDAYDDYFMVKRKKLSQKFKEDLVGRWWRPYSPVIREFSGLLWAQAHRDDKVLDENVRNNAKLLDRIGVPLSPLTFMKMFESEYAQNVAKTKRHIIDFPEGKFKNAFSYAGVKARDVEQDLQPLKQAFQRYQGVDIDGPLPDSLTRDQLKVMQAFHDSAAPEDKDGFKVTDTGFTALKGIRINPFNWRDDCKFLPLVMHKVSQNDVIYMDNSEMWIKTAEGTANYSFMSDAISIQGLKNIRIRISAELSIGKFGAGFLTGDQGSWLVHKSFSKKAYSWVNEDFNLPPSSEDKVIFVITNNQPEPARSRFEIRDIEIIADEKN
jgi:hypothetical protein